MTTEGHRRKVGMGPVIVALVGAVLVAVGATLWSVPAGFIIVGIESIITAYLLAYWRART
jgi:hypothetical protein